MADHTPGPWVTEGVNSDYLHDICLGYHVERAGNPILVATVYFDEEHDGPIGPRAADANARLIAAAPDLLAACEAALKAMWETGPGYAVALCRAAIAKAKGE